MAFTTRLRYSLFIASIIWVVWLASLGINDALSHVINNWHISLTMAFGSIIAGATSEGGGAVAFPVFTKLLHIAPWDAKLFAIAIQSIGMTAASLVIFIMRIKVEWHVILWASIGGAFGMLLGATWIAPFLPPDVIKMTFTVMASSFALVLAVLNRQDRNCHCSLPEKGQREKNVLLLVGFIGGILSSMVGTGIDILTFSVLVLLFRVSEKIATPTSVILMAINSIVGLFVYVGLLDQMNQEVFSYWMAAIPIVVVGAPLGAIICAYMSRKLIANFLIGLIAIELISSLLIIQLRTPVIIFSVITLIGCLVSYYLMLQSQRYQRLL